MQFLGKIALEILKKNILDKNSYLKLTCTCALSTFILTSSLGFNVYNGILAYPTAPCNEE